MIAKLLLPKIILVATFISICTLSPGDTSSSQATELNPVNQSGSAAPAYKLEKIAGGLQSPTGMEDPNDGSGRLFIIEQQGLIRILDHGKLLDEPFLDLRSKIIKLDQDYDERGLLSIALHPGFKTNHKFYVFYTAVASRKGSNCKSVVAEYEVSVGNANKANASSSRVLLEFNKPESNHDGGQLIFGPDGYLYIGVGDGGGAGDEHGSFGNGQDLSTYLGKILRIDVNHGKPYDIPADNPFIHVKSDKAEIFAYGLRNPWRFSFDTKSGRLFCGDVGQDAYEEVDIIKKGGNYGWRRMEACHCYNPSSNCKTAGMILPIDEYKHGIGISITGGFVYHGRSIPALDGKYIFADWSGPLFYLFESGGKWTRSNLNISDKPKKFLIESLGQDHQGELYFLTSTVPSPFDKSGTVYKLIP